ncbi:MAG: hypothetical protein ABEI52_09115, partial [Halobacteriaceae archaeon]
MAGRRLLHALLTLLVVLLVFSAMSIAASEYTLQSTTSIETPDRTISLQGDEYTVDSIGTATVGGSLNVDVARPGDGLFTIYLYNKDGMIMDSVRR